MSVFNNGFFGFQKQVAGLQDQLNQIEVLQTSNDTFLSDIQGYLGKFAWCSPYYTYNIQNMNLDTWYAQTYPDYIQLPYAGTYMLVGGFSIGTTAVDGNPVQQVECQVWNVSTTTSKGIWYVSNGNNAAGNVLTNVLGGNVAIRFSVSDAEVGDDFDLRVNNFSSGTNAAPVVVIREESNAFKYRIVYLGANAI